MSDLLLIAVAAATVNNFVLVHLLGLAPVLDPESRPAEAPAMAAATTVVIMLATGLCQALEQWVLGPYGLPYLRILGFVALTLLATGLVNQAIRRRGYQLPLAATNGVVLGIPLLTAGPGGSVAGSLALGLGAGLGFSLVMFLFAGLRTRLESAPLPAALRGPAIAVLTVGLMSLAFVGFSGLGT